MAKQTKRRQSAPRRTRRQEQRGGFPWPLLLLLAVLAGAWYLWQHDRQEEPVPAAEPIRTSSKPTDENADYRDLAKEVQRALVARLEAQGATVTLEGETEKSTERSATGGKILWHAVNMAVVPTTEPDIAEIVRDIRLASGRLTVGAEMADTWQGKPVNRYDVQFTDSPDGTEWTLTLAHLYIAPAPPGVKTAPAPAVTTPAEPKPKPKPKATAGGSGKLAIVVDDCGNDLASQRIYEQTGRRFTLAVMPDMAYTHEAAVQGHAAGLEIFVHMPMEPLSGSGMEARTIRMDMTREEMQKMAQEGLDRVPYAIGVNNHQGSRLTADREAMRTVLAVLARNGMVFLDSATAGNTIGDQVARSLGMPSGRNEIFLDNEADEEAIRAQIRKAAAIAKRDGTCIAIGHCRPHTAAAVASMIDELEADGIELVFASQLLY